MDNAGLRNLVLKVPVGHGLERRMVLNALGTGTELRLVHAINCKLPPVAIEFIQAMLREKKISRREWISRLRQLSVDLQSAANNFQFSVNLYQSRYIRQSGSLVYPEIMEYKMDPLESPYMFLYEQLLEHQSRNTRSFAPIIIDLDFKVDSINIILPDELLMRIASFLVGNVCDFKCFRAVCKRFLALPLSGIMTPGDLLKHWMWWFGRMRGCRKAFIDACSQGTMAKRNAHIFNAAVLLLLT
jgi:hypothetical protein